MREIDPLPIELFPDTMGYGRYCDALESPVTDRVIQLLSNAEEHSFAHGILMAENPADPDRVKSLTLRSIELFKMTGDLSLGDTLYAVIKKLKRAFGIGIEVQPHFRKKLFFTNLLADFRLGQSNGCMCVAQSALTIAALETHGINLHVGLQLRFPKDDNDDNPVLRFFNSLFYGQNHMMVHSEDSGFFDVLCETLTRPTDPVPVIIKDKPHIFATFLANAVRLDSGVSAEQSLALIQAAELFYVESELVQARKRALMKSLGCISQGIPENKYV